jgi:hypothetical protein
LDRRVEDESALAAVGDPDAKTRNDRVHNLVALAGLAGFLFKALDGAFGERPKSKLNQPDGENATGC